MEEPHGANTPHLGEIAYSHCRTTHPQGCENPPDQGFCLWVDCLCGIVRLVSGPITVAILNDYQLVVNGLRRMLLPFSDRVRVVELGTRRTDVRHDVDIALFDSFGRDQEMLASIKSLLADESVSKVALYTWTFEPDFLSRALQAGASGVLSKTLTAGALVAALEQIHSGQRVISPRPTTVRDVTPESNSDGEWPGRGAGLTQREAEMIAMITRGHTNAEIASTTYLSPNSVKSYIRSAYRKMGVERRAQAVAWGIEHGMGTNGARSASANGHAPNGINGVAGPKPVS